MFVNSKIVIVGKQSDREDFLNRVMPGWQRQQSAVKTLTTIGMRVHSSPKMQDAG